MVIAGANLMANQATDRGPADRSKRAAIRQDGTRDAADAGTGQGVLVSS